MSSKNTKLNRFLLVITLSISAFVLFFFYTRGFIPHDEGWIISPAQRISEGELPYRDFHYIYTPGVAYVVALGFKLFGASIIVARLIALLASLATIYVLIQITREVTKKTFAYVIPVAIYITWLPMHINFAWPVVFTILSGLTTCWLLLLFRKKRFLQFIFLAGITTGLTLLFKQNFGLALFLNNIIFFIFERKLISKNVIFYYSLGLVFFPIIMLSYFYANNALIPFANDMNFFMLQEIILKGKYATPFIYPDIWYRQLFKALLYLFPLLISLAASISMLKKNKAFAFLASFCALYYLMSIRPITDLIHLVPLLSVTGIPLLLLLLHTKRGYFKVGLFLLTIFLAVLGAYSAIFMNYYRWNTPIIHQDVATPNARLGVLTDQHHKELIPAITKYVKANSKPDDYIFIYSYSPSFYLLAERKNPTKFIWLPLEILSKKDQKEITASLTEKQVPIVLADHDITKEKSLLASYIRKKYNTAKTMSNFTLWQRKP